MYVIEIREIIESGKTCKVRREITEFSKSSCQLSIFDAAGWDVFARCFKKKKLVHKDANSCSKVQKQIQYGYSVLS